MYFTSALFGRGFGSAALNTVQSCVSDQALFSQILFQIPLFVKQKACFILRYHIFCLTFGIAICLPNRIKPCTVSFLIWLPPAQMPINRISIGATYTDSICSVSSERPGGSRYAFSSHGLKFNPATAHVLCRNVTMV